MIAQAKQYVVWYAFGESLTADSAFLQVPAKDTQRRGDTRHSERPPASDAHQPAGEKVGDDDKGDADEERSRELVFVHVVEHRSNFSTAIVISLSIREQYNSYGPVRSLSNIFAAAARIVC